MYPVSFGFMFVKSFLLGCSGFCADSPIPSPDSEKRAMNGWILSSGNYTGGSIFFKTASRGSSVPTTYDCPHHSSCIHFWAKPSPPKMLGQKAKSNHYGDSGEPPKWELRVWQTTRCSVNIEVTFLLTLWPFFSDSPTEVRNAQFYNRLCNDFLDQVQPWCEWSSQDSISFQTVSIYLPLMWEGEFRESFKNLCSVAQLSYQCTDLGSPREFLVGQL